MQYFIWATTRWFSWLGHYKYKSDPDHSLIFLQYLTYDVLSQISVLPINLDTIFWTLQSIKALGIKSDQFKVTTEHKAKSSFIRILIGRELLIGWNQNHQPIYTTTHFKTINPLDCFYWKPQIEFWFWYFSFIGESWGVSISPSTRSHRSCRRPGWSSPRGCRHPGTPSGCRDSQSWCSRSRPRSLSCRSRPHWQSSRSRPHWESSRNTLHSRDRPVL